MEFVGAGAFEKTSMMSKFVWVSSVDLGPRSVELGGPEEGDGLLRPGEVVKGRDWRHGHFG